MNALCFLSSFRNDSSLARGQCIACVVSRLSVDSPPLTHQPNPPTNPKSRAWVNEHNHDKAMLFINGELSYVLWYLLQRFRNRVSTDVSSADYFCWIEIEKIWFTIFSCWTWEKGCLLCIVNTARLGAGEWRWWLIASLAVSANQQLVFIPLGIAVNVYILRYALQ